MKRIFAIITLLTITLIACKKDPLGINANSTKKKSMHDNTAMTPIMSTFDYPDVDHDILKFRDFEHYNTFYEQLEELEKQESEDGVENDLSFDDKLNAIENYIGFTSIRKAFYLEFEAQNEIGWNTMDEVPTLDMPLDDIALTLLNTDKNLIVGDTLYNYFNDSVLVKAFGSYLGNISTINNAHGILDRVIEADQDNFIIHQKLVGCNIFSNTKSSFKTAADTTWNANTKIEKSNQYTTDHPYSCGDPYLSFRIQLSGFICETLGVNYGFSYGNYEHYIDWGDGTNNTVSPTNASNTPTHHTFPASGTYNVVLKVRPLGYGYYPYEKTFIIDILPYSCSNTIQGSNFKDGWEVSSDGQRCIYGKIKSTIPWLPNGNWRKVKAKSKAFKRKNNKWKYRKVNNLSASFDTDVLQAWNCVYLYDCIGNKLKQNRKYLTVSGYMNSLPPNFPPPPMGTGDLGFSVIKSKHEVYESSTQNVTLNLELRACQ